MSLVGAGLKPASTRLVIRITCWQRGKHASVEEFREDEGTRPGDPAVLSAA